ncbi:fungal-specific transcription factor domain-containing protein [Rhodocollybia butyracea]|uniref:Fungal-specific transcription factor domain-containing protein n=1 Tax=Rhodocollybia butyracea TaxID=206335 RepID=A0A9P5PFG6_9AGAR|nr:fungal-specific transcription factor domain-containing protein [Rhodocollybia butyracea]
MHPPYPNKASSRRSQGACDFCRKKKGKQPITKSSSPVITYLSTNSRKVRCDSATRPGNICYNCQNADVKCTHSAEQKKRGPRVGTIRKHPSESVQALVTAIVAEPDTYPIPDDPNVVRKMLLDLSHCVRGLERQLSRWRRTVQEISTETPTTPPGYYSSESSEEETLSVQGLTINDQHPQRHFGKSSNLVMMRTAVDITKEVKADAFHLVQKRPELWVVYPWYLERNFELRPLVFPEDDLLSDLCTLYFKYVHDFVPVLHRPTFERSITDKLHLRDYDFGTVVLCVCAIASRYSKDPRNFPPSINSELSLGWPWYSQISHFQVSFIEPPSLYLLQRCCLSAVYLVGTAIFHSTWGIIGQGIRLGQEMGVHRKQKGQPRTVNNELWRRTFWMLLNFDVFLSINFGRPRATTGDDFDLELPVECDDEYWENEDPAKAFVQPPGVPPRSSFFIYYSKLLKISGFAYRTLYSVTKMYLWKRVTPVGPHWDQKVVTEVNTELNQWLSSLPEHYATIKERRYFNVKPLFLRMTFGWSQIQLHKQFIPRPNASTSMIFPSLAICTSAARDCVKAIDILEPLDFQFLPHLMSPIYVSPTVLLLTIWRDKRLPVPPDTSQDRQGVDKCMTVLSKYEHSVRQKTLWAISFPWSISMLIKKHDTHESNLDSKPSTTSCNDDKMIGTVSDGCSRIQETFVSYIGLGHEDPSLYPRPPCPPAFGSQDPNINTTRNYPQPNFAVPNYATADWQMNMDATTTLPPHPHIAIPTPPTSSTMAVDEDWSSFMANVDQLLLSVGGRVDANLEPPHRK